jgi:general secretion pathway protein C
MLGVAQRFADWRDQSPEEWLTAINRCLPFGVTAALVIAIAYQLSTITWTLVPGSAPAVTLAVRGEKTASLAIDSSLLTDSHLFGEPSAPTAVAVPAVIDAPDTTLRLTLTGILANENGANGFATISSTQDGGRNYEVGQSIDGTDGATLHAIFDDRVVLNRNGELETLRFPNVVGAANAGQRPPVAQITPSPGSVRETIAENAE